MKKIIFMLFIIIFSSLLAEAQWYVQQTGTTSALYDIEFINKSTGWCCGNGGYIIKTTNGGENWIQQGEGVTFEPLLGIHPVDSNIVYAVGFFRTVVKTTDGGTTWIKIESGMQGDGSYECVFFINDLTGWIGNFDSPEYGVRKTINGGQTIFSIPFNGIPRDLYFKDSLNGVGVGGLSYIYRTTDGGLNWSSFSLVFNGDFYRVSFINENTGYTASHRAVYKTTDFGSVWDSIGYIPAIVYSISFANEKIGFAGTGYNIWKTTTGGNSWSTQVNTGVVYNICAVSDSLVWTCGNAGRIWHTTNGGISFVQINSSNIPTDFKIFQNYPNPFNNQTKIRFTINQKALYKLEVYNTLGSKVAEIFNQIIDPGEYETTFSADNLNSGVYYYRLLSINNSETKQFVLIK